MNSRPLVISPRGTLEGWALAHHKRRKEIAYHLWEHRNLKSASMFHATSEGEAEQIRRLGLTQPIAIIPNGIESRDVVRLEGSLARRRLLFMSRLHPKKGLDLLIEAWGRLHARFPNWQLTIAGPDESGYSAGIEARVAQLGIPPSSIEFVGAVFGEAKWRLLASANLFVLPTHSENFGNVIAEALSQGVPVVTTKGTPWSVLAQEKLGWWVDVGLSPLLGALEEALALSSDECTQMGARGRAWVERHLMWADIAGKMSDSYDWLSREGKRPDWVWV